MLGLGEEKSDKVIKTKILTRDLGTPGTDTDRAGLVSRGQSSGPRTLPGLYQGPERESGVRIPDPVKVIVLRLWPACCPRLFQGIVDQAADAVVGCRGYGG